MVDLTEKVCRACEGGTPPLTEEQSADLLKQTPDWFIKHNKFLKRKFEFKDFKEALDFVNKVGKIAEKEGHHPDITLGYGYVKIELTTHAIKGLSENDFIVAAKINQL